MTALTKRKKLLPRKAPWPQLDFPKTGFPIISNNYLLDEETLPRFGKDVFCTVNIGDVFASRYQIVAKLGYSVTSTVWLARDLPNKKYVSLKIFTQFRSRERPEELDICAILGKGNSNHSGRDYTRTSCHEFKISQPGGELWCLVQEPICNNMRSFQARITDRCLPLGLLKLSLKQIFASLDYIHTECKLVHTDIKAESIFSRSIDSDVWKTLVDREMLHPVARKPGQYTVYGSCGFISPDNVGTLVLGDFGSAVRGDESHSHVIQQNPYRCPEALFHREWSYPADIWNMGVVIWDLFEGEDLFEGHRRDGSGYSTETHLVELIAALGPPPLQWLEDHPTFGTKFADDGQYIGDIPVAVGRSLESKECRLEGFEREEFLHFIRCMLQWKPEDRMTAKQLLDHPWLKPQSLGG